MSMQSSTILEKIVTSWPLNRLYFSVPASVEARACDAPIGSSRFSTAGAEGGVPEKR